MKKIIIIVITVVIVISLFAAYEYFNPKMPPEPEEIMTAAEFLNNKVYDTEVKVYGVVSGYGLVRCPCFFLESGGELLDVWYSWPVQPDEESVDLDMKNVKNGNWLIVTGKLSSERDRFETLKIEKAQPR